MGYFDDSDDTVAKDKDIDKELEDAGVSAEDQTLLNLRPSDKPGVILPTGIPSTGMPKLKEYNQGDVTDMLSGMDDTTKAMNDAVARRSQRERTIGILRGLSKIGTSMAGAKQDEGAWSDLEKGTGNEVRDLQDVQKQKGSDLALKKAAYEAVKLQDQIDKGNVDKATINAMVDPDSQVSKMYREVAAKKYGKIIPDNMSAWFIHKTLLDFAKNGKTETFSRERVRGPDGKNSIYLFSNTDPSVRINTGLEAASVNPGVRIDPDTGELIETRDIVQGKSGVNVINKEQSPFLKGQQPSTSPGANTVPGASPDAASSPTTMPYVKLNNKQQKFVDKANEDLSKDKSYEDSIHAIEGAKGAQQILQFGESEKGDIQRAIQNMLARATGERGVMTEQDVAPFKGRQDVTSRLTRLMEYSTLGEIPASDRKFLQDFSKALEQAANNRLYRVAKPYTANVTQQLGDISPTKEQVQHYLNLDQRYTMPPKIQDPFIQNFAATHKVSYEAAKKFLVNEKKYSPKEE